MDIELTSILAKHLQFSYTMEHFRTHQKLVELIAKGHAEMALGLTHPPPRFKHTDFSTAVTVTAIYVLLDWLSRASTIHVDNSQSFLSSSLVLLLSEHIVPCYLLSFNQQVTCLI